MQLSKWLRWWCSTCISTELQRITAIYGGPADKCQRTDNYADADTLRGSLFHVALADFQRNHTTLNDTVRVDLIWTTDKMARWKNSS